MRRLGPALALLGVLLACIAAPARAADVYIINHSQLPDQAVADALPAFQQAVDQDFGPEWNIRARLRFTPPPELAWTIELVDEPNCFFCAGYHEVLGGEPFAQVGIGDPATSSWQITFTHELFELLADPFTNRGVQVKPSASKPYRWYALEVCDPVEADRFAYTRKSLTGADVFVSDFVTEAWFRRGAPGPWDFTHATVKPLSILAEGYQLVWSGRAWTSLQPRGRV